MRTEDGARAWQTLIFTAGSNLTQAAQVHANVHAETGESLPVLWEWNAWRTLPSAEPALLDASLANFSQLYDVLVERFPQLPSSPFGIALGDEPPWELVHGRLSASAAAVKRRYPHAITHINLQFRTITNASVPPILGAASGLDWVGSDLYYSDNTVQPPVNASVAAFREIYNRAVYPHLRPDQKIVLVPFAHCKRSSPPVRQLLCASGQLLRAQTASSTARSARCPWTTPTPTLGASRSSTPRGPTATIASRRCLSTRSRWSGCQRAPTSARIPPTSSGRGT